MAKIKEQIIGWFNGTQDYDEGMKLLEQVSNKNKLLKKLKRRGFTKDSFEKLIWELKKAAGLKIAPAAATNVASKTKALKVSKSSGTKKTVKQDDGNMKYNLTGGKDIESYTPEARRLIKEYSSLYMQRGKAHSGLRKLGEENDQKTIDKRKILIDKIAEMEKRLDILFKAFNSYEKEGIQIDVTVLWPENSENKSIKAPETIEDLKNQKKNIQSSITKDRNMLNYSNKTKPANNQMNPMPASPKRTTLEKRVAKKEAEITTLDQKIADLG